MPKGKRGRKVRAAAAPVKKEEPSNPLFKSRPRIGGVGGAVPPKKDLRRFLKWPRYVRLQRQKRVLLQRLKVPPAISQFSRTLDKNMAVNLFKFLAKYKPEDKVAKKDRLRAEADALKDGKELEKKKPMMLKFGLNHVTNLIERKQANLVIIAHDVDPIELVVFLPTLCHKMDVPYCIVKGKARLGQLVHQKTAACVAVTDVRKEDLPEFRRLTESVRANFNDRYTDFRKMWGGGILGHKTEFKIAQREKALQVELAKKYG